MLRKIDTDNFTLVLSGGGALGIAHLGVLHDLEQKNIVPKEIVGTSMGGIIGACLAIGMSEANIYKEIVNFSSVNKWIKFSFSGNAVIENDKISTIFYAIFKDKKMKDTNIPLKLIATNLTDGHKRVFSSTDDIYLRDALLATMAIPGVFKEHYIEGHIYGDGFLCENLGITQASSKSILAVDVLGEHSFDKEMPDNFFKTLNVVEMFEKSMRLLIYNQTKSNLSHLQKPTLLIEPCTKEFKTFQFHKHKKIRHTGLGLL